MTDIQFSSPSSIHTLEGRQLDVFNIRPGDLNIADVAQGLATKTRWNGFYDLTKTNGQLFVVAQHAVICAKEALYRGYTPLTALFLLHHDDSEAFLNDMVSPIKQKMPEYKELEARVQTACYLEFCGCDPATFAGIMQRIHEVDSFVGSCEAKTLGKVGHSVDATAPPLSEISVDFYIWPTFKAIAEFRRLHDELVTECEKEDRCRAS